MHMARKLDFQDVDLRNVDSPNVDLQRQETPEQMAEDWKQWEGQVINGRFRLLKFLGGSKQGAVFLVECPEEPRQLAIKLVAGDAVNRERRLAQWKLAQKLSHPHLLPLLEAGRSQLGSVELVFVVMEYAEENLAQVLPHRPLTPAETLEMLSPVLGALAHLHGQGFVHGRLKPANVMAIQDQIKLSSQSISTPNEAFFDTGEPNIYNAPETTRGEVSAAADVWSLGVTLTEVLTQRAPRWKQHNGASAVWPENLPAPFDEVVRECLNPEPQQRCKVADIAARLNLTSALPQKPASSRSLRPSAKKRFLVPAAVAVLAAVVIVAGVRLLRHQSEGSEEISAATSGATQATQDLDAHSQSPRPSAKASHSATASAVKPSPSTPRSGTHAIAADHPVQGGDVVHQVLPDIPQKALDTIHGTVRIVVKVQVDASGNVTGADLDAPGPSPYFARLAMQAAKSWTFAPYRPDSERAFLIRFDFTSTGTTASATRAGR
jgi:TonB family protein